jgi:hypothetical protein
MNFVMASADSPSSLTQGLAILGAVTGLLGISLNLLNYLRNRPRLRIKSLTEFTYDHKAFVKLEVRNEGLQPVDIVGVGLAISSFSGVLSRHLLGRIILYPFDVVRKRTSHNHEIKYNELAEVDGEDEIIHLTPGKRKVIKIAMEDVAGRVDGGRHAWPYVEDFAGSIVYAGQPAHVQSFTESDKQEN